MKSEKFNFNFLSFHPQHHWDKYSFCVLSNEQDSFLILNSLSSIEKNLPVIWKYQSVYLYLDRDNSGVKQTLKLLCLSVKYIDRSTQYKHYKDLNEWLIKSGEKPIMTFANMTLYFEMLVASYVSPSSKLCWPHSSRPTGRDSWGATGAMLSMPWKLTVSYLTSKRTGTSQN